MCENTPCPEGGECIVTWGVDEKEPGYAELFAHEQMAADVVDRLPGYLGGSDVLGDPPCLTLGYL